MRGPSEKAARLSLIALRLIALSSMATNVPSSFSAKREPAHLCSMEALGQCSRGARPWLVGAVTVLVGGGGGGVGGGESCMELQEEAGDGGSATGYSDSQSGI